ncbi:hypothetical protein WR25_08694 [Diploscapter pachys]|uniref:UPAR/Ly6 domain-containing protein n=1 Tax=Diploscapter pachys TaxID=2018661 RepID=A0A2A2L1N3_9BILA|nr:hypothetical protein WR25_08694 [Diploscapter pachys]
MWSSVLLLSLFVTTQSLKCWNCVGSDCDTYRKDYSNWELEECAEGAQCQTTHYTFHSNELNETFFGIVTRSCSYETGCMPNKMTRSCLNNVNMMVGAGCYQRECCMTDGCNTK